jgi:hypothetical protein
MDILKNKKMGDMEQTKKSLMNALENLEEKAKNLYFLAYSSDNVINKLNNPRSCPEPMYDCDDCAKPITELTPNLIDLFIKVAEDIDRSTNRITKNIYDINSFIE